MTQESGLSGEGERKLDAEKTLSHNPGWNACLFIYGFPERID
jgi:hypothetical protein